MRRVASATTLHRARLRPALLAVLLLSLSLSLVAMSLLWDANDGSATRAAANLMAHARSAGEGKAEAARSRVVTVERLLDGEEKREKEESAANEAGAPLTPTSAPTPTRTTPTPMPWPVPESTPTQTLQRTTALRPTAPSPFSSPSSSLPTLSPTPTPTRTVNTTTPTPPTHKLRPTPTRLDAASARDYTRGGPQHFNWMASTPLPTVPGGRAGSQLVNGVDPLFPPVKPFPSDAAIHNESFVRRSLHFDATVSRAKGIILCLHDGVLELGLSLIRELRCLGNTELIQVYHCLPRDLSDGAKATLLSQDNRLEIIDVCSDLVNAKVFTRLEAPEFKSYWIKPLAVHHTNLHELILLDADDILLRDPSFLRENDLYRENGTLFFYDRLISQPWYFNARMRERGFVQLLNHMVAHIDFAAFNLTGSQPSQHLLDSFAYQGRTCHEMDSSMVLIDKTRAGMAMGMLWWLITRLRPKFDISWGDKEAFWLAYELAQQPYAFPPRGVSVVSSSTNRDMEDHSDTLCGSIAQYVPSNASTPAELLYVNGRALLDPLTQGVKTRDAAPNVMYNVNPTHLVPRMVRTPSQVRFSRPALQAECLVGLGSTPLPEEFQRLLFRRRLHFLAASSGAFASLAQCEFPWR